MATNPSVQIASAALAISLLAVRPAIGAVGDRPATVGVEEKLFWTAEDRALPAGTRSVSPAEAAFPPPALSAARLSVPGELIEEEVGAWEWAYFVTGQGRGNIYQVTIATNLYEHRMHLYAPTPTPAFFVVYRGTAPTGAYTLIHAADVTLDAGNALYSSGPCNVPLQAGFYYYIGATWQGTAMYARSNALPPESVSFGSVVTSVPADLPHYPPAPQSWNSQTGYPPCHQVVVTGQEPPLASPGRPEDLIAAPLPGSFEVELSWTNPTVTTSGAPLQDLDAVCVRRNGETLVRLTQVEIGAAMSWTDRSIAHEGCQEYRITAENDEGCGWPAIQPVWAGAGTGAYQTTGIAYDWTEISEIGTDIGLVGDDQTTAPVPIGFDFPFYSRWYDAVRICSNGFLSFTTGSSFPINMRIPDSREPNSLVAPYWDDLDPSVQGAVYTHLADGPRFIVEWHDLPSWGPAAGHFTFQAILHPTGAIHFQYETIEPGVPEAATVGIEDETGANGLEICYCLHGPFRPEPGSAIGFLPLLSPESVERAPVARASLSWPMPNPAPGAVRCLLALPAGGRVDLRICDAAGRLVRRLPGGDLSAGSHDLTWDGLDAAGRPVPRGVYFLRLDGDERAAQRITVVR